MRAPLPPNLTPFRPKLEKLIPLLRAENQQQNLVATSDPEELWNRHILDALIPLQHWSNLPEKGRWVDMGSGAGLPLLPLAICLPGWRFCGIEPRKQRAKFLTRAGTELGIGALEILATRSEDVAGWKSHAGQFDVATCRALGSLVEDGARALPLLREGGRFGTLKLQENVPSIDGYGPLSYVPYRLAGDTADRHFVFATKSNEAART